MTGEIVDREEVVEHHPDASDEHVSSEWRVGTLEELGTHLAVTRSTGNI
jgi:hypothetical protein